MTTTAVQRTSGATILDSVPDGYYTITEAAELVGKSKDTLKRWRQTGVFVPSAYMQSGELTVYLYSDADIDKMKALAPTIRPGRKAQ